MTLLLTETGGAVEAAQSEILRPLPRSRLLMRGESVIASVGLSLAALLLCVMTVSVWWTLRIQRSALETARSEQIQATGKMLVQSAELLLPQGELTAVRRMVGDAARANGFSACRIVLPDGSVVASAQPAEVTVHRLPSTWPTRRGAAGAATTSRSAANAEFPLTIPNFGPAELQIAGPWTVVTNQWETAFGACSICAVALGLHLVLYRRVRSRLRGLGAVREALAAVNAGEMSIESLRLSPDLGPEAQAWNRMIDEAGRMKQRGAAERSREALGRRQENNGELDTACDALSQGLLLVDDKCKVRYTNGAAAVFLRAKREELLGGDITQFLQIESVLNAVREVADGRNRRRSVHDIERKDEGAAGVLRFVVRPVRREDSGTAIVTIEDITQQRAAEEARNRFVAQATHELRTPLTNIRLYVETAIEDGETDAATRSKCLNVINGETRRLERIVGEMLSVAEMEAGSFAAHYDDVRLDQLFDDLRVEYEPQAADKNVTLVFTLPPKLAVIQADRDKLLLALHNLVGNALKYTPKDGRVEVVVEVNEQQLTVRVKDSGIGIGEADQEKIFDRFYRAKDPRVAKITGTGLGLTLAREVVRLHGGDITVESQIDHGSTFTLAVPVARKAA